MVCLPHFVKQADKGNQSLVDQRERKLDQGTEEEVLKGAEWSESLSLTLNAELAISEAW